MSLFGRRLGGVVHQCRTQFPSACYGAAKYKHGDGRYCILHLPSENKNDDFKEAIKNKLEQKDSKFFDFRGIFFPKGTAEFKTREFAVYVNFHKATFHGEAAFPRAKFSKGADFTFATFSEGADFFAATFRGPTTFAYASFVKTADFVSTTFENSASFFVAKFLGTANFAMVKFESEKTPAELCSTTYRGQAFFGAATFKGGALFIGAAFEKEAQFEECIFKKGAYFAPSPRMREGQSLKPEGATFKGLANFRSVTFEDANFADASFEEETDFVNTTFKTTHNGDGKTDFRRVTFKRELYFKAARFSGYTDFYRANFLDAVKFIRGEEVENGGPREVFASEGQVSFTRARMEKPELVSFDTPRLRPSWLVGVDARKFDFTGVEWEGLHNGSEGGIDDEIQRIRRRGEVGSPYVLLEQACQRLATNAEENRQYPLANEFHYWSMDARRLGSSSVLYQALLKEEVRQSIKEGQRQDITRFRDVRFADLNAKALLNRETWQDIRNRERFGLINRLYWALSGYGVRPLRAAVVLIIMSLVFALLYSWPYIEAPYSLQAFEGLTYGYWGGPLNYLGYFLRTEMYSLGALARLNPEPKPTPGLFQTLVIVAGILGPLQVALLALAIRRKVMR